MSMRKPKSREGMPLPKDPLERNIVTTSIVSEPPRYGATPRQPMTSPVDQEEDGNPLRESRWRIPLSSFEGYVASMQQSGSGFAEQLTELESVGTSKSAYAGKDSLNARKNAFKNIVPYDDSRVKLNADEDTCSDYINASHIRLGCGSSIGYIASQLPTRHSLNDWWRMIWEKNVVRIVLMESPKGRPKTVDIWPEEESDFCEYGRLKVQWAQWTNYKCFSTRKIFIQKEKYRRPLTLYLYTPTSLNTSTEAVTSLVNFHQFIHDEMKADKIKSALLVCCKLGTGKTGTFICLNKVAQTLRQEGEVEIYHTLKRMREQRMQLVKTAEEYELIHLCVLYLIKRGAFPGLTTCLDKDVTASFAKDV
ncbi:receptor-type tyrosine-protein phosphatase eta-like isoform X2 [Apostichopus japonicus]|uniref:receptor-type tyrosine-protein phosphatase eta-like isoform X2 n=1 Tax=Stichopus japonicus TaxID=307972 RepID=UPI003AB86A4A